MRIVLSSLWAPVGVAAYLLRAARRLGVEVVTVGPTMGAECWGFKEFSHPQYAILPDFLGVESFDFALDRSGDAPDLWIDIDGGHFTDAPMNWPHAIVATDPHMDLKEHGERWSYKRQREVADFFFCMQRPYCNTTPTVLRNPSPTAPPQADHFLPYAYDSEVFHPYPAQKMDAAVTVLGLPYTKRRLVAAELQKRGFRVLAGMGSIYEQYARDLCRAPVCFIWSLKDDVPCRVFEAAACGRVLVVNESIREEVRYILPDLPITPFPDGGTEQENIDAACQAVGYWFGPTQDRPHDPISAWWSRGNDGLYAVTGHTWEARLRQIVKTCTGVDL